MTMCNMFPHHLETAGRKGAKCTGIIKARGMGSLNMFPHNRNLSCLVPTMVTHMHFAKHARAGNVFPSLVLNLFSTFSQLILNFFSTFSTFQVASLALVLILATRWRHLNLFPIWPPDGTTCISWPTVGAS